MRNDELDSVWLEVEIQNDSQDKRYQRMVYVDLLYRAYIGATGIPAKRYLSIEIPQTDKEKIDAFTVPKGFTVSITEPNVKHAGYVACVLQATTAEQNDVFTVVAKDILDELRKKKSSNEYITTLIHRVEKWRDFFKNPARKKLSEEVEIGLIGELSLIETLLDNEVLCGVDLWNGPIRAAQDFQGDAVAMEVKTSVSNSLEHVYISSEVQLDDSERDALYLVVYRVERNDAQGVKLPELVTRIHERLSEQQKNRFIASLLCLGYVNEDSNLYTKGYIVREQKIYKVEEGFPRVLRRNLPQGVTDVDYKLSLFCCASYETNIGTMVEMIKGYEHG